MSHKRRQYLPIILVLAAGSIAYANSFGGSFFFDDDHAIIENPHLRKLWPLTESAGAPPQATLAGRPVAALSFALNYAISGLDVWSYHATNLAIHLLAGMALLGIARRTLRCPRLESRYGAAADELAAVVACAWVVHPLQTESVTYIVQRVESLMGLFYLATVYFAVRGSGSSRPMGWHAAAAICCALGMATKEVMATAPLLVLLYDRAYQAGSFREALRRRWPFYCALAATWAILAMLVVGGPRSETAGLGIKSVGALDYARSQFGVVLWYLRLTFWPHPLCLDYAWPLATNYVLPAVVIVGLLAATVAVWRRRPWAAYPAVWFFVILAPTSSVIPIKDLAFEHRMYLPLAGVAALVAVGGWQLLKLARVPAPTGLLVGVAMCAALTVVTIRRNADYQDGRRMWEQVVALRPENARARSSLSIVLCGRGDFAGAIGQCREALRVDSEYFEAPYNLGRALATQKRYGEAMDAYRWALKIRPDSYMTRTNLGEVLASLGRHDEAIAEYRAALEARPDAALARRNLAIAYFAAGRWGEAVEAQREALSAAPHDDDLRSDLGMALLRLNRTDDAIRELGEVGRNRPGDADAATNLGSALLQAGRIDEAEAAYRRAIEINPQHVIAHLNLGMTLAQRGKRQEAATELEWVLRVEPENRAARQALDAIRRGS